jgi:hypothetical protein
MDHAIIGTLIGIGSPALIGLALWVFAKYLPKEGTFRRYFVPIANAWAITVYAMLGRYLKKSDMEKVDEGFFKTLAYWLDGFIHTFIAKLDSLIESGK